MAFSLEYCLLLVEHYQSCRLDIGKISTRVKLFFGVLIICGEVCLSLLLKLRRVWKLKQWLAKPVVDAAKPEARSAKYAVLSTT